MPIEVGLGRLGDRLQPVAFTDMDSESRLESVLTADITVVDPGWLLTGRQVLTAFGKFKDLRAIDSEGQLMVIEPKKSRTPRQVVSRHLTTATIRVTPPVFTLSLALSLHREL
jgi:hypothetical protein